MANLPRIYLDNAATSWPKPEAVYSVMDRYLREVGAAAGRGVYQEANQAAESVAVARHLLAELIGAEAPRQVIFTLNGTDALNLALYGSLVDGDHVITTVAEHNSVLRPLRALEEAQRITVTRVPVDSAGVVDPAYIQRALRRETKLVALTHASNVTGAIQPAAEIGAIVHEHDALFLLDAAQTLGDLPLDVDQLGVDLLAAPGHKGLLGPLGTGMLYVRAGIEARLASVRQGGTGSQSEQDRQPATLPDKYEAGNLNVPGIVGLAAGLHWIKERGLDEIRRHALLLTRQLVAGLSAIKGVRLYGPSEAEDRVGVVSITLDGYDPQEVAMMLDTSYRVQTRPGLHCAPLMHGAQGTLESGGTVRFSIGPFTTEQEISVAITAVEEISAAAMTV